jgi:hypothetical protein
MTILTRFVIAVGGGAAVMETRSLWLMVALLAIGALA